tara:strand:- start:128 stop:313 length:186 start_codon:yes stop_codon:yes gene_type:complete
MSKEFVDAIAGGDNIGAEKAFSISMSTKVGDSLEAKRKELANTFVNSSFVDQEADVNDQED